MTLKAALSEAVCTRHVNEPFDGSTLPSKFIFSTCLHVFGLIKVKKLQQYRVKSFKKKVAFRITVYKLRVKCTGSSRLSEHQNLRASFIKMLGLFLHTIITSCDF